MARPTGISVEILALKEEGYSYNQIVEKLGCSKSTVSYWLGQDQAAKSLESSRKARVARYKKYYALKNKPCTDCGLSFPPPVMHWDHMGEEKKDSDLSRMIRNSSWDSILAEIAKCELVCSNCHALRTIRRSVELGTASELVTDYYNEFMKQAMV